MSTQPPAQNNPQLPHANDSGEDKPLRTRYYLLIMTAMVVIGIIIDIAIFIGIVTNAEGSVRIPYLVFILPVVGALAIGRLADAAWPGSPPTWCPATWHRTSREGRSLSRASTDSPNTDSRLRSQWHRRAPATDTYPISRRLRAPRSSRARYRRRASTARIPRISRPTDRTVTRASP